MNKITIKSIFPVLLAVLFLGMPACTLDEIENPNAPDQGALENGGATLNDLRLLASGLESVMRVDVIFNYTTPAIIGREYWDLRNTDPRYTGELLGAGGSPLDPNGFSDNTSLSAGLSHCAKCLGVDSCYSKFNCSTEL